MDFYEIRKTISKEGTLELYPDFKIVKSNDLMVRGRSFYAIWDERNRLWSTDEYDVQRLVDEDLMKHKAKLEKETGANVRVRLMSNFSSRVWAEFKRYLGHISDNVHVLDSKITFANDKVKKKDYVSKKLDYEMKKGKIDAYEEIISTLYSKEERAKIEWSIGAIISGDAKEIQKFIVLFGAPGTGKGTILNIIQKMFHGYYTTFEAKAITSSSNAFATETFKDNPLIAFQHDGDLSKIEDNSKLNSIVSHEEMMMNEKYKPSYTSRINCFLYMASNKPVKITDSKSGIIRRLIDVQPNGTKIPPKKYSTLISMVEFEFGAIAYHCLEVYRKMGKNYYSAYKPLNMMYQTDFFFNFVEYNFHTFKNGDGISLKQAYDMYKDYCDDSTTKYKLARHKFREELKEYFKTFHEVTRIDGKQVRSYYEGFITDKFTEIQYEEPKVEHEFNLVLDKTESILDEECKDRKAQYASKSGTPQQKWSNVKTKLKDLDTKKIHYLRPKKNHIVIDFDIKNEEGDKSPELNMAAASKWPPTYAEFSKSGGGIHLHYYYDGDVKKLSSVYDDEIEIKKFTGKSSLRRKLSKCNNIPIRTINSGLPLKGDKKVVEFKNLLNEQHLRRLIIKNLKKEIHPSTKPSVDFIHKLLEDAYSRGLVYDVSDMRPDIMTFANNSTNQAAAALKVVSNMKFKSEEPDISNTGYDDERIVFFDTEVFKNLFIIVWKYEGDSNAVKMINPTPEAVEGLMRMKLVGFNNRKYDNHILYARYLGYNNERLYELSQKLIGNSRNATFMQAYSLSYGDVLDFSAEKKGLKKFEIDLGLHHEEWDQPWDKLVPEDKWDKAAEYCEYDVLATEAVYNHKEADRNARHILASLSGLTFNDKTQKHAEKFIFGDDKNAKNKFITPDLSKEFPGYKFENGKSTYKGYEVGEGGFVFSKPGMYGLVDLLDIASQHPRSLIAMNHFGPYTKRFEELVDARLMVKHGEFEKARKMLDGALVPFLKGMKKGSKKQAELSYALKIIINIVYGMTSAPYDNPFRAKENVDNVVAKRGALFMIDLLEACENKGYNVVHIKTDSIKISDSNDYMRRFVYKFGEKYGYTFEHEATYEKFCIINKSTYVAKDASDGHWTSTGTQLIHPYVFKKLFSKEPITLEDKEEVKAVTTSLSLNFNEEDESVDNLVFVGKVGSFVPIKPGAGGGLLMRKKGDKYHAATGSKGYRWMETEKVKALDKESDIDLSYYQKLCDKAIEKIKKYGDYEWFVSDDPYISDTEEIELPWD